MTFGEGMRFSQAYHRGLHRELWSPLEKRFDDFFKLNRRDQRIPKVLHQIWLGSKVPEKYGELTERLREQHPGWTYKLWTDDNIDFDLVNRSLFEKAVNPGQKSDILRYEILRKFGGIYLDLDFIVLRPFDCLLHLDGFAGLSYDDKPQLLNGLVGCAPGSGLASDLCRFPSESVVNTPKEILDTSGPNYFTEKFLAHLGRSENVCALPNIFFYPYPNFPKDRIYGERTEAYISDNTMCCHLWHCSWTKHTRAQHSVLRRWVHCFTSRIAWHFGRW
jgi:hypothetical protein